MEAGQPKDEKAVMTIFRALRHRNYRLFFFGQGISLIGTWMQEVAIYWLVYQLTGSVFLLGVVGFASKLPNFIFAPVAGVMADRWKRHRLLIITQTFSMLQAIILAFLVLAGAAEIWHILILSVALGFLHSVDMPLRHAFLADMIEDRTNLGNAVALNSTLFNVARLVGPSIAGILIATTGEGICFLVNGLSFIPIIAALLAMKITFKIAQNGEIDFLKLLKGGFSYVFGFVPIRYIMLLLALASLMGMPYSTLMPVFAKDVLQGGPYELGFLTAAAGGGATMGAVYLASRKGVINLGRIIPLAAATFGVGLVAFSLSNVLAFSLMFILIAGFGTMIHTTTSNTILQNITDDDKRGRVMAFYMMAISGMATFGNLLAGSLASEIGAPYTILIGGASCIVGALLFAAKLPALKKKLIAAHVEEIRL
ncbi:MAG: MFS transporter [Methanobacteriota archaeon]